MIIDVSISAKHTSPIQAKGKTVVIIDVLRATSVIITAMTEGAKAIVPCISTQEAFNKTKNKQNVLLCGERYAQKIEGFDLSNSPLEFTRDKVEGKTLYMTTTNGTNALLKAQEATRIFIGAFINIDAVAKQIVNFNEDVLLVCAGTNGEFSLDDALCAGGIINILQQKKLCKLTDIAQVLHQTYSQTHDIHKTLSHSYHYNILLESGFKKDLQYCLQENTCTNVPIWNGSSIANEPTQEKGQFTL